MGPSLDRTDKVVREMSKIAREEDGVAHTIDLPGYSAVLGTNISNVGGMFVILDPFEERAGNDELGAPAIIARLREKFSKITAARVGVFGAPPVEGLGTTGGFKLQVQDRRSAGLRSLQGAVENFADEGNRDPQLAGLFTSFSVTQPQLYVDVDEEKAKAQQIKLKDIDATLQAYLGSFYVNDFFFQNRNWQVNLQAAPRYRMKIEDIGNLEVRNAAGNRVPLRTLINVRYDSGPAIVNHYNLYPSAEINGGTAPGVSSGQAINIMDGLQYDGAARHDGIRMDRADVSANPGQQRLAHQAGVSAGGRVRVPGAVRAVRKLVVAAVDHSHRADVPVGGDRRHLAGEFEQRHLHADRPGRADRPGGQERDSDCGIRQAVAGPRQNRGSRRPSKPAGCGCGQS